MVCTNAQMDAMVAQLEKHLTRSDRIGYAAARNTRILREEAREYFDRRDQLILKYGEAELDEEGKPTGRTNLSFASPKFKEYSAEILEWAEIEHDPPLYKIPAEEAIGRLTGQEILEIDWMLED